MKIRTLTLLTILLLPLCSCGRNDYCEITGYAQGGNYRICYKPSERTPQVCALKYGIDSILCVIDSALSGYNANSLVSRINEGEDIVPDSSAQYVLLCGMCSYCDSICAATGGAVDCRAAELYDIWGFGFKSGEMPDSTMVSKALSNRKKLNFNAVAQGYSADLVAGYLMDNGVENMLVDIGGEFFCKGLNPKGKNWKIGIDAPIDGNDVRGAFMAGTFTLPDTKGYGVVTSGNYRKFRIIDGRKYSHTIDPRSGYPVTHELLSATVIASSSALADALATYCMVIGPQEAEKFIESRDDIQACLITADAVWTSSGLSVSR